MKTKFLLISLFLFQLTHAQSITSKLDAAIKNLEADAQLKHAIISMNVVDSKTNAMVYSKNEQIGLAPASCQKVITSVSAFELLGKDFRYKTELRIFGMIKDSSVVGNTYVIGYGDPTLGSWRYPKANAHTLLGRWKNIFITSKIKNIGNLIISPQNYSAQSIPKGWIWEDLGNYYGAGDAGLNWRENQFELFLDAGNTIGKPVNVVSISPKQYAKPFINELKTGSKNSGDNAYVFFPVDDFDNMWLLKGTIPLGAKQFKIMGSVRDPILLLKKEIQSMLDSAHIFYNSIKKENRINQHSLTDYQNKEIDINRTQLLDTYFSPMLDSINYWFLKKSINLYGEAFVKTIAYEKKKFGDTDTGISIIKDFWKDKGIEPSALNIIDGSGLSPANRVTTNALVTIMQYAKNKSWFSSFYNALPEMNGIKMKDGYINGVRSYTGYIKSKTGQEYTFSFIVNNFDGNPATVREKMWKLLDILK